MQKKKHGRISFAKHALCMKKVETTDRNFKIDESVVNYILVSKKEFVLSQNSVIGQIFLVNPIFLYGYNPDLVFIYSIILALLIRVATLSS